MKNYIKNIVFIIIILFVIVACNKQTQEQTNNQSQTQGTNPFLGTWIDSETKSKIFFNDKKWMLTLNSEKYKDSIDGTYTFNNDNATLKFVFQADEYLYPADINGNTLKIKIDANTYNFTKE